MSEYYYKEIIEILINKIDGMKAHEEELRVEIDRLMAENVRLNQVLREKEEK